MRLSDINLLQTVTTHEVLETPVTPKSEVGESAFGIGVPFGKVAVDSILNSK